jgi:hypothetical protein
MRDSHLRPALAAGFLALLLFAAAPAGAAAEVFPCSDTETVAVPVSAIGCSALMRCTTSTGCDYNMYISVSSTAGVVGVQVSGVLSMSCGPSVNSCARLSGSFHVGFGNWFENCSWTGVAAVNVLIQCTPIAVA